MRLMSGLGCVLTVCCVTVVGLSLGCNKPKQDPALSSADTGAGYDYATPSSSTSAPPAMGYGDPPASSTYDYPAQPTGQRKHIVAKGDTLYALARSYYGDQKRWRDIYEANRDKLPDPNRIKVGQELIIP